MKDLYFYEYLLLNTLKKKGQQSESILESQDYCFWMC